MHELMPLVQISQLLAISQNLFLCMLVCFALTVIEKIEQHIFKFCQKHGHSCLEAYDMIHKAFGNESLGRTQVEEWFRQSKEGWTSVESDECSREALHTQESTDD
jgi:hypothetical protein